MLPSAFRVAPLHAGTFAAAAVIVPAGGGGEIEKKHARQSQKPLQVHSQYPQ